MKQTVIAHQKFMRETARKLRLVSDLIRGMKVDTALVQLKVSTKKAARTLKKVVEAARANAINNSHLQPGTLIIKTIEIMEGPTYKRWRPVSRGRAHPIMKRTAHIKVIVEGEEAVPTAK